MNDAGHEVLTYFAKAAEQILHTDDTIYEADEDLDTWIAQLLDVRNEFPGNGNTALVQASHSLQCTQEKSSDLIPMYLPALKDITESLTLYSTTSPETHILLETCAPRSICSEEWLTKSRRIPLKKIDLPSNMSPFRFAGHPIYALYGVQLAASIADIQGQTHSRKLFVYVLPPTPSSFLLGLTDQRRLGFDISLTENHSSYLRVSSWDTVFPLVVT